MYTIVDEPGNNSTGIIVITPERIAQIATGFNSVWKRMPTDEELDALIEGEIRDEVYYRDALALGLDKNDAVVRRRLRQKMEFLTDTGVYLRQPSAGELEAFFAANEHKYRSEPRLAFEQIYLGKDPVKETVTRPLEALLSDPAMDPSALGEDTRLPAQLRLSRPEAIDSVFGQGFFEQLAELAPGVWSGPVVSPYGVHLVRTLDGLPARTPPLKEVREVVLKDWKAAKALENREQDYARRRGLFVVEIHRGDKQDPEKR